MPQHTPLLALIVAGLVIACVLGMLVRRAGLSPIVGYLVAGVLVGPHTPGFVADYELAHELAEIGVILLMFGVGLHFAPRDLMAVRGVAVPGALAQIVVATALGCGIGLGLGWTLAQGLVFGLALSVASTVVLLRALEEREMVRSDRGRITVGWLIVEDLAMVGALVVMPALAEARGAGGAGAGAIAATLAWTVAKVAIFAIGMLLFGRRVVPWLLQRAANTDSRELFTLAVLAIAMGIAFGAAALFGVSFALGAFFAGMVLAESDLSHRAGEDILPLQDAFAVLFFISVGMLFNPGVLLHEPLAVLAAVLVVIVGKSLAALVITRLLGEPAGTGLTVAAGLGQVGEFSFILAGLGLGLGLLPQQAQDLILAAALISIALNPILFNLANWVEGRLPRHPRLAVLLGDAPVTAPEEAPPVVPAEWAGHAVVIGHGRVGSLVSRLLRARSVRVAVIEQDIAIVERLQQAGIPAVAGEVTQRSAAASVGLERAKLVVFAIPDGFQTRRALEIARSLNPDAEMVVRTHSEAEQMALEEQGVRLAVMGERELALRMGQHALEIMGVPGEEARLATGIVPPRGGQPVPDAAA